MFIVRRSPWLCRKRAACGCWETGHPVHELTGLEREILRLVDQGMSNKQIARQLGIEVATAKNHVHNTLRKLHVHRRIEASDWYRQGGFHLKLEA